MSRSPFPVGKQSVRYRPISVEQTGDPGSRERPPVKRDLSRFSVSDMRFGKEQSGTSFGEAGASDDRRRGLPGGVPRWANRNKPIGRLRSIGVLGQPVFLFARCLQQAKTCLSTLGRYTGTRRPKQPPISDSAKQNCG
jgi:hypothetical protein